MLAFYFVNTVFCTIGFGDISGSNNAERLFCVMLFYTGVFVFGSLLVEVQEAISEARQARREREREINQMVEFLRAEDVPRQLERQMAKWADFGMRALQKFQGRKKMMAMVPSHLHRQLLTALHHGLLSTVPLFMRIDSFFREDLQLDLWEKMKPQVYSPFTAVAADGFGQNRLYVICSGTIILQRGKLVLATLHTGDSFDEDWLLLDVQGLREDEEDELLEGAQVPAAKTKRKRPGSVTDPVDREHNRYVAVSDVLCMCLDKTDFEAVVATYDDSVASYFDFERQRRRGAAANRRLCTLDSHDSDSQQGDGVADGPPSAQDGGAARAASSAHRTALPERSNSPIWTSARKTLAKASSLGIGAGNKSKIKRTWSHDTSLLRGSVARERWIHLTRRAYHKLYVTRHSGMAEAMQADARLEVWRRASTRIRGHHTQQPKRDKNMRRTSSVNDVHALNADEDIFQRVFSHPTPTGFQDAEARFATQEWIDKLGPVEAAAGSYAESLRDRLNSSGGVERLNSSGRAWHNGLDLRDVHLASAAAGEDGPSNQGGAEGIVQGLKQDMLRMSCLMSSVMARIEALEALEQHQKKGQGLQQESAPHRTESSSEQGSERGISSISRGNARGGEGQRASSPDAAAAATEPAAAAAAAEVTSHKEMVDLETEGRAIERSTVPAPASVLAGAHLPHAEAAHAMPAIAVQGSAQSPVAHVAQSPIAVAVANPLPPARADGLQHDGLHAMQHDRLRKEADAAPLTPTRAAPRVSDADAMSPVIHREGWSKQAENIASLKSELETMKLKLGAVRDSP